MMLEKDGDYAFDHALHHGAGEMTVQHHFAESMTLPVAVQTWTMEPGVSEGSHAHTDPELEEFYLVLSGSATMRLEGETYELSAGDSLLSRPGTEHDLVNTGNQPLRILVVWGPPGEVDFSQFGTYQKAMRARAEESEESAGR